MNRPRTLALLAAVVCCVVGSVYALYSVSDTGDWPKSWPKELEPLRKQAKTYVGPQFEQPHYEIPFAKREEFEAAWPHLLKVKTKGAPIYLVRAPTPVGDIKAGVWIHDPLPLSKGTPTPKSPLEGDPNRPQAWIYTTYIELVVDGEVVDLNRIELPADTPIIDQRFEKRRASVPADSDD
jgi:hypothetical protein